MSHTLEQFTELVRIAKLQLSGMRDPAIAGILPGAPRISISVSDLLDELLGELRILGADRCGLPASIVEALNSGDGTYRP